jgi:flagellar biosynthesis protein FlhB
MQSVQSDFRRATLNVSAISPCTGLQNWWFLMRWKEGLKELLNISFSSIVHVWTCAQILMETATSLSSLVDD